MKVAIFGKRFQTDRLEGIKAVFNTLSQIKAEVSICEQFYDYLKSEWRDDMPSFDDIIMGELFEADYVLSIGGDGTFLNTAKRVGKKQIPILGINTGRLGFLSASDCHDAEEMLQNLSEGCFDVEERSLLALSMNDLGPIDYPYALNEISVMKRDISAMLHIHARLNGEYLNDYQADGLIVATPTGSTAYSMSVGGPILLPENKNLLLSPIAPHSLTVRPLVLDDSAEIRLSIESRNKSFLVSLDGRSYPVQSGTELCLRKAGFTTRMIRRQGQSFVSTLRSKLMWGKDLR